MPSFFYHLAIDLETAPTYLDSRPEIWEIFRTARGSTIGPLQARKRSVAQRLTSKEPEQKRPIPRTEDLEAASGQLSTCQPVDVQARLSSSGTEPHDWRYGKILSQGIRMTRVSKDATTETLADDPTLLKHAIPAGSGGLATKGRFEPVNSEEKELGWGVIRLYRDGQETSGLYDEPTMAKGSRASKAGPKDQQGGVPAFKDEDCTTLCILAVPSYLTPSDFLGFVGEKTRDEVSHFRMIRTERSNRYMVLMKFRNGRKAREWRREWNGKAFDGMEVLLSFRTSMNLTTDYDRTSLKLPMWSSSHPSLSSPHPPRRLSRPPTQP